MRISVLGLIAEIRIHLGIHRDEFALHEALDQGLDFIPPREQPGGARRGFHWAPAFDLKATEPLVDKQIASVIIRWLRGDGGIGRRARLRGV